MKVGGIKMIWRAQNLNIEAEQTGYDMNPCHGPACFAINKGRLRYWFAALLVGLAVFLPSAYVDNTSADNAAGLTQQSALLISGWQGAKNYGDSFSVEVSGGSSNGEIRFLCSNCSVSPSTGSAGDRFTVTVKAAGTYTLTAIMSGDSRYAEVSDSKRGSGGKADQQPLIVQGWGNTKGYYRTFAIQVTGGSLNGAISFETDGCTVSPQTGPVGSYFTVTVTRVGTYSLTALMEGDKNHNTARSAQHSGVACRSDQSTIAIDGWQETARYGDTFTVEITGGLSSEPLVVRGLGCTVTKISGSSYEVAIESVGPYSLTASRSGNYGYNEASSYAAGVSRQADQPDISISGWVNNKNANDTFGIRIRGGVADGVVHFATSGCTVSPITGTVDMDYFVTVSGAGSYTLIAYVDGTANYNSASSREVKGTAGKAPQPALSANNWDGNAATGSSFDFTLVGGRGNGAMSVTTHSGCSAILKAGQVGTYTVTVTAKDGEPYELSINKLGDASYFDAQEQRLSGVAAKKGQSVLGVNGWKENSQTGEAFAIHLEGGSGNGAVTFDTTGCTVDPPRGTIDDIYTVTITAGEEETYSLAVNRDSDGAYSHASVLKSGSVRPRIKTDSESVEHDPETPMLGNNYDVWLLLGMVVTLIMLLSVALFLQHRERQYRRRRYRR